MVRVSSGQARNPCLPAWGGRMLTTMRYSLRALQWQCRILCFEQILMPPPALFLCEFRFGHVIVQLKELQAQNEALRATVSQLRRSGYQVTVPKSKIFATPIPATNYEAFIYTRTITLLLILSLFLFNLLALNLTLSHSMHYSQTRDTPPTLYLTISSKISQFLEV